MEVLPPNVIDLKVNLNMDWDDFCLYNAETMEPIILEPSEPWPFKIVRGPFVAPLTEEERNNRFLDAICNWAKRCERLEREEL